MNDITIKDQKEINESQNSNNISMREIVFSDDKMANIMKMADMMASGTATVPKHLQKNPADCMAVIIQAMQWGMNPFAVAQKTHIINGALGYEAQLINAVIQASNIINGSFKYEYSGDGASLSCRVGATVKSTGEFVFGEWLCVSQVKVKNSPLWATNPKQQLGYLQVKNWARLYYPSAILGVYSDDELQDSYKPMKNITPQDQKQSEEQQLKNDIKNCKIIVLNKCKELNISASDFAAFFDFGNDLNNWKDVSGNFEKYAEIYQSHVSESDN